VRQDGYQDFTERILVQPGQKELVRVAMEKAATGPLPDVPATVKIAVNPSRAAVFLDGLFVGHVGEFEGLGRGMLVAPGTHQIRIALPGYQTFETDISLYPPSHPFTAERIFGLPETAAFSASSVSIRSRTFLVISSSTSGALRISTGSRTSSSRPASAN
jgi:hypothetical protein